MLLDRARWDGGSWIDTELVGGFVTARARRRHELGQQRDKLERHAARDALLELVELPDSDLEWLLSMGWTPEGHDARVTP